MTSAVQVPQREHASVLAVVVTRNVTPYLAATLGSIAAQTTEPDRVVVAVWDPTAIAAVHEAVTQAGLTQADVVATAGAATFGAAVRAALRDHPAVAGQWLWLFHDDAAPASDALAAQLRAVEQAASVVLVGAKQVEWDAADELISVGVGMTRSGRRFTALEEHEIDQGQYDDRSDVLAVPIAGALVRRDIWEELHGPDAALGPYLDGADLARRARLAGHRVVVAPDATVRHARASYLGLRGAEAQTRAADVTARGAEAPTADPTSSWSARRRAFLHFRLASASPLGAVGAFLGMFLLAPLRALGRVATKEFSLIGPELRAPFAATARLGAVGRSRRRAASTAVLPRRVLRQLQVGPGRRLAAWRDTRLHRAAVRRAARARSELEIAEAAAVARRRRLTLLGVLVATVAVAAVTVGSLLGGRLVGGALLPVDASLGDLWTLATSPWLAVGDGHAVHAEPILLVLAALTTVFGGPWGVSTSAVLTALMVAAIPLAAVGAWFAAGAASRSLAVRAWVAGAWALMPTLLVSLADGRIGAVLAHLTLPWVCLGVARALGVQRRDVVLSGMVGAQRVHASTTDELAELDRVSARALARASARGTGSIGAAAAAGLAFAVACAGAPVLLPIGIVVVLALWLTLPRASTGRIAGRWRLVLVLLPALALLGPWLTDPFLGPGAPDADALNRSVRLLLSEPGLSVASAQATPLATLLGWPSASWTLPGVPSAVGILLPLLVAAPILLGAVVALLRGGPRARAVRIAWVVAALALAAALALQLIPVGASVSAGDPTGLETATPAWPGPAVSVLLAALLVAAAVAGDGWQGRLGRNAFGWRQGTTGLLVALLSIGPALGAAVWVWAVAGDAVAVSPRPRADAPVPALGLQVQTSASAERVLSLLPTADGIDVQLWRSNGPQLVGAALTPIALTGGLLAPTLTPPDAAETDLAIAVARLTASSDDAVTTLTQHAVGVIVIPPVDSVARPGVDATAAAALAAQLDGTAGLERVTTNAAGTIWRVVPGAPRASVTTLDGAPSDTTVLTSRDLAPGALTSGLLRAGGELLAAEEERLLVMAERADSGWQATLDGVALEPVTGDWRQTWTLPAGAAGEIVIRYVQPGRTAWIAVQLGVGLLALLLALPTRRRLPGEEA